MLSFPYEAASSPANFEGGLLLRVNPNPNDGTVVVRFGVSFLSSQRACQNAEEEVPTLKSTRQSSTQWDWNSVQSASQNLWEAVLQRIEIDTKTENQTVVELLYSSVKKKNYSVV